MEYRKGLHAMTRRANVYIRLVHDALFALQPRRELQPFLVPKEATTTKANKNKDRGGSSRCRLPPDHYYLELLAGGFSAAFNGVHVQ